MTRTLCLFFLLLASALPAQYDEARYPVIPRPYRLLPFDGDFRINSETVIVTDSKSYRKEIEQFRRDVKSLYGITLKFASRKVASNFIYVSEDSLDIAREGYDLFINRNDISLYGGHAGIFYGLQTLLQLIHVAPSTNVVAAASGTIPSCSIIDQPRFSWRGLHLDVARHFFPKENVKEYLRWMAMYKLNVFHWHLTDDQGWRIEIKKYPKLTQVGGWRNGTLIGHYSEFPERYDSIRYGGFYTQEEIREVVRYADSLHITIVPEIEMPGHASAILAAYPEFGCTGKPVDVVRNWGVFDDVLCPTEKTFAFLDDVLKEVCALFPGKYIHIGGDECPKAQWKASAFCQELMKQKNLKDENELQSWFTQRIVAMLQAKNRQAIGWDEILEGGLAEGAAVMSWRGEEGGIAAAKAKHEVVMSPGGYCYFDHYQSAAYREPLAIGGFLPLEKVYRYNPVPASLSAGERNYILGVQANLWTEYIGEWSKVQYMLFPRICALSEVAWSQQSENDYAKFSKRLIAHFSLLDRMKINYAKSFYDVDGKIIPTNLDALGLNLSTYDKSCEIRYSFESDSLNRVYDYNFPIIINSRAHVYAAAFKNGVRMGNIAFFTYDHCLSTGKPISLRKPPHPAYNSGGPLTLVNGQNGEDKLPWKGSDWLGWSGDTLDAMIDLGSDTLVSCVTFHVLTDSASWIYAYNSYSIETSEDGKTFQSFAPTNNFSNKLVPDRYRFTYWEAGKCSFAPESTANRSFRPVRARYVHLVVYPHGKIPPGNPGEGNPAWLFVSEINVE